MNSVMFSQPFISILSTLRFRYYDMHFFNEDYNIVSYISLNLLIEPNWHRVFIDMELQWYKYIISIIGCVFENIM